MKIFGFLIFSLLVFLSSSLSCASAQNAKQSKKKDVDNRLKENSQYYAQNTQLLTSSYNPLRIEIEVAEDDIPYAVLPLNEFGIAVIMNLNEIGSKTPQRLISFYDQNLDRRWTSAVVLEPEYQFLSYRLDIDSIHFALSCLPDFKSLYPFIKVSICLANGAWNKTYIRADIPTKTSVLSLHMRKDRWGFLASYKSSFLWHDLPLNNLTISESATSNLVQSKSTAFDLNKDMDWCHIAVDTLSGTVYSLFRDIKIRDLGLVLCSHTLSGDFINKKDILLDDEQFRIIDAKIQIISPRHLFIAGTVNLSREKQNISAYDRGSQSIGLFANFYTDGVLKHSWVRPYLDFSNVDSLISKETLYNLQQSREKAKGRTIIPDYTAQLRIGKNDNGYFLLGEVYNRVETSTTEMYYDYYGRMVPYTRTFFEGFRYKDAFWITFDSLGVIIDERIFDIDRTQLFPTLSDYTQWVIDSSMGDVLYSYPLENAISFRLTGAEGSSSTLFNCTLQPLFSHDKVQKTWGIGLVPWYKGCFLAYGHQQIWNNRYAGKTRRNVFYLQKIISEK